MTSIIKIRNYSKKNFFLKHYDITILGKNPGLIFVESTLQLLSNQRMKRHIESFAGYCPNCDKKIAPDASFCHHCGHCLIKDEPTSQMVNSTPYDPEAINQAFVSTTNLYMLWFFTFSLVIASGIFYHFYHQSSPLIATGVIFFYCWIFLISKLDALANLLHKKSSVLVYAGLLLPVLGTIISYNKISSLVNDQS